MLDKVDVQKYKKPLMGTFLLKVSLSLSILIFICANNQIGFNKDNEPLQQCDRYTNDKISNFKDKILSAQFLLVLLACLSSGPNFVAYYSYRLLSGRHSVGKTIQFTETRLRTHFVLNFIESICIFTVFARAIETFKQKYSCNQQYSNTQVILVSLSSINSSILLINTLYLFKLLQIIKKKVRNLDQLQIFTGQITLRENLLFNSQGYMQNIFKLEKYSSRSAILKDQVIKEFPSGYKRNQVLTTRQIVHRLRGGHKNKQNAEDALSQQPIQFQSLKEKQTSQRVANQKQKQLAQRKNANQSRMIDHLKVNEKVLQQNPNEQNYQRVQMTLNVLQLSVTNQLNKKQYKLHNQKNKEQMPNSNAIVTFLGGGTLQAGKAPQKYKKINSSPLEGKAHAKSLQARRKQELELHYNLTPNSGSKPSTTKNPQNIDQGGKYLFVDVEMIKKKCKDQDQNLFSNQKSAEVKSIHPNSLYARKQWKPRQKRMEVNHEKNIQQCIKNLQQIRKQQTPHKPKQFSGESQSQQDAELSSQINESQKPDQIELKQNEKDENLGLNQLEQSKKQKSNIIDTKIYLHLKRLKVNGRDHKYKLYEDEQGFYDDDEGQDQKSDIDNEEQAQFAQEFPEGSQKYIQKDQATQRQKNKIDEKFHLKNRQLQTQQAIMLRFIRTKYVQPQQLKKIQRKKTVAEQKRESQLIMQLGQQNQANLQQ